jgi:hypothetical protein
LAGIADGMTKHVLSALSLRTLSGAAVPLGIMLAMQFAA